MERSAKKYGLKGWIKEGKKLYTGNILNEIEPQLNLKFNFISNLMCNTNSKISLTIDFPLSYS